LPRPGRYAVSIIDTDKAVLQESAWDLKLVCAVDHWAGTNLYGWVEQRPMRTLPVPFQRGQSRDPDEPGVLISLDPRTAEVWISVGSAGNWRPRIDPKTGRKQVRTDGAGVFMTVTHHDGDAFSGTWGRSGLVYVGNGTFQAHRVGTE
jgi:hypothetical protein